MSQKPKRKAGIPDGLNRKSIIPYTNASETINSMIQDTKEKFLREQKMPTNSLQFTRDIFEELHLKQQQELTLALIGLSDEYQLSKVSAHLAVPPLRFGLSGQKARGRST